MEDVKAMDVQTFDEGFAEFKIRNGKYMDKWPNSLTSVWPCTKVYGRFVDLVCKVLMK